MNRLDFLRVQQIEIEKLLLDAVGDPILEPQLRYRLEAIQKEISQTTFVPGCLFPATPQPLPRAAIFLRGGGVVGSTGIRPALAGEALIQYERMFTEQAIHDEREAARINGRHRRPRGASTPALLLTGTPRGSFGLEFVPQPTDDASNLPIHAEALKHVADALLAVGSSDSSSFEKRITSIPPKVVWPLKQFFKVLSQHRAELRISFPDVPARVLSEDQIFTAAARLDRDVATEEIDAVGVFRGLTRETGHFDLMSSELGLVTGHVADGLTEEDMERIGAMTNQTCFAHLLRTTVVQVGGEKSTTFLLIDARRPEELSGSPDVDETPDESK